MTLYDRHDFVQTLIKLDFIKSLFKKLYFPAATKGLLSTTNQDRILHSQSGADQKLKIQNYPVYLED